MNNLALRTAWKVRIGSGYSGIAVADGHVVTMFADGESDVAAAFDERTGKEQWRFTLGKTYKGHDGSHTGPIATPLIHNRRVYVLEARGAFYCLDLQTGKKVWSTHLVEDHGAKKPHYGFGTSPMLIAGALIVQVGAQGASVVGFDPATGKKRWATNDDSIGYQSPIPYRVRGHLQVLAATDKNLLGIDPRAGTVLWEYAHEGGGARGVASLTPVPAGDDRLFLAHRDDESRMVNIHHNADSISPSTVWENRAIRNSYNVPVYHDGYVYAYSSRFLTCVDAATGDAVWRSRQPGDGFLILVDGHLVIVTKKGSLHVARATPNAYEEVAALPMFDDLSWSAPAFADGSIYVRSLGELARVNIDSGTVAQAPTSTDHLPNNSAFARFLAKVQSASDKKPLIDRFIATHDLPVTEPNGWIHFVYRGAGSDLAVAGDMFGARQERAMTQIPGTDIFYYSTQLEPDARVNYLFFRDYEQILDPRNPRKTTTTILASDMEMSFTGQPMDMSWVAMPKWQPPTYLNAPEPTDRGTLKQHEIESEALGRKHNIGVYLPPGYSESDARYPVAYMQGGGPALKYGKIPDTLDRLIGKTVAPTIVVFVHNVPFGPSDAHAKMMADELVPFIDETYRTIPSRNARASLGMGMAGASALVIPFRNPEVFGMVATQSAFLFDMLVSQIDSMIKTPAETPLKIYMDWGKYDLRNPHENWDIGDGNRKFAENIRHKGYTILGGEVHDGMGWPSWRNRTQTIFESLFPKK